MNKANNLVCAVGIVCVTLIGCQGLRNLSFLGFESEDGTLVYSGSPEGLATFVQAKLSGLGLAAVINKDGETVKISSKTASGKSFTLVFARAKAGDRDRTRMKIVWENGKDEAFYSTLILELGKRSKESGSGGNGGLGGSGA